MVTVPESVFALHQDSSGHCLNRCPDFSLFQQAEHSQDGQFD